MSDSSPNPSQLPSARPGEYVVVARRYRPQVFEELVGQEHVAKALSGAIATNRVGHAYLFTGARGVGKTSAARILSKALNCQQGPTTVPCNQCDICRSIGSGEDIDVLEIDGASNRGIDEIRQLRQNVNVRPSRSRLKIYIIDEVHMLTREAFNALLKTLEEPPEHVKFIFCTTEPSKIPVTILSRCQRFDFAGIPWDSIAKRLQQIVDAEGVSADPEALYVLARRATGSMRDSQSLLEQLLAFAPQQITLADVHGMLGTAGEERLGRLAGKLVEHDAAAALGELDAALHEGVDATELLEQLFGYFRDCMAAAAGCPPETFLYASPGTRQQVVEMGKRLGLETVLAAMQILDQTLSRLRYSIHVRLLAELALVRICKLEDLQELPAVIAQLQSRSAAAGPGAAGPRTEPPRAVAAEAKGNPEVAAGPLSSQEQAAPSGSGVLDLTPENAAEVWSRVVAGLSGLAAEHAKHFDRVAIPAPDRLVVRFKPGYTLAKSVCERPEQLARFEQALAKLTGRSVRVEFTLREDEPLDSRPARGAQTVSPHQRIMQVAKHPMIRRAEELFGAQPVRVDGPPPGN